MSEIPSSPSAPSAPAAAPRSSPSAPAASPTPAARTAPTSAAANPNTPAVPKPGETQQQAEVKKARRIAIKVDGASDEIDIDAMSDEEIAKAFQMSRVAPKRMQESAELKKQFAAFQESLKKDPFAALKDPAFGGLDLEALAEQRLAQKYAESIMPEQERQRLEIERERDRYKTEVETYKQEQATKQQAELDQRVFQETETEFLSALETSGLPRTKQTLYMMAEVARINLDHGLEMTSAQMAQEVQNRINGMHKHVTTSLKGDALIKHLGPEVVKEIVRMELERVRGTKPAFVKPTTAVTNSPFETDDDGKAIRKAQDTKAVRDFFRGRR